MRNEISFYKRYRRWLGLSSSAARHRNGSAGILVALLALGLVLILRGAVGAANRAGAQVPPRPPADTLPALGRPAPGLAAILVPPHAPPGSYRVSVLDLPIEAARTRAMSALSPGARQDDPPGAWVIERTDPLAAFGEGGLYDRSKLARVYGGKPASILRAPVERGGRVVASLTLISPYPDSALERLSRGTLAILFVVDAGRSGRAASPSRKPAGL